MGWTKKYINRKHQSSNGEGIKIGCWNKGGALQPLKEKRNEIENILKSYNFGVLGITEANFFKEDSIEDVEIVGYKFFCDKGRSNAVRNNSRCAVYVREDLSFKLREDLMRESIPEIWIEIGKREKDAP